MAAKTKAKKDTRPYQSTQTLDDAVEKLLEQKVAEIRRIPGFLFWDVERQKRYIKAYSENFRANHGKRDMYTDEEIRRYRLTLLTRGKQ